MTLLLQSLCGEWVVRSSGLHSNWRLSVICRCPRVVGARQSGGLLLNRLLLLLLTEPVHLISPRIVGVLWLNELLLRLLHLLPSCLLRLIISISVLESSLLWLQTSWLAVRIVQEAGLLRLLLLERIPEPVHRGLLLITLVEPSRLGCLVRSVIEEQIWLLFFELPLPELLLFFAQLYRLSEIVVCLKSGAFSSTRGILLGLSFRSFQRKLILEVVVLVTGWSAWSASIGCSGFASKSEIFQSSDARLPRAPILPLGT